MAMSKFVSIWKLMSEYTFEVDTDSNNENMSCIICKRLLVDACQGACGCQYCHNCINLYLSGDVEKYCPGGKTECNEDVLLMGRDVTRNRAMNNKIYNLNVLCPNDLCRAKVLLTQMEEHLRLCTKQSVSCPYITMGCDEERAPKVSILTHLHSETLVHTKLLIEWIHNLKNEMNGLRECSETTRPELADMKDGMKMKDLEIREINAQIEVLKEYGYHNMDMAEFNEQMDRVEDASRVKDIRINALARDAMDKEVEMQETRTRLCQIEEESRVKNVLLAEMKQQIINLKKENIKVREESRSIKTLVETFGRQLRETRKETKTKLKTMGMETGKRKRVSEVINRPRMKVEKIKATIERINMNMSANVLAGGLTFTLERFSARKEGERIASPYFYSHINGYKLQLLIYPRQYGPLLSVCFVICKGENDSQLEWPCKYTVGLGVVNQYSLGTESNVVYSHGTMHINCKYLFLRPGAKDNHPYECRLISHDNLRSSHGLIVNDSVVIKCTLGQ